MSTAATIIPEFHAYRRDVSEHYTHSPEGRALLDRCGGMIYDVFVFDYRRHVHCCEMTPSYELWYVETIPGGETHEDDADFPYHEDLDEALREANLHSPQVIYIHCHSIDVKSENVQDLGLPVEWWNDLVEDNDGDEEGAYLKAINDVVEGYHAHPVW